MTLAHAEKVLRRYQAWRRDVDQEGHPMPAPLAIGEALEVALEELRAVREGLVESRGAMRCEICGRWWRGTGCPHCGTCAHSDPMKPLKMQDFAQSLLEEIKRLKAAQQWQPIETAPRDGTWILLCNNQGGTVVVGCWELADDGERFWCMVLGTRELFPTHWMPLPEPPDSSSVSDLVSDSAVSPEETVNAMLKAKREQEGGAE